MAYKFEDELKLIAKQPAGAPFPNMLKFKSMPQKCDQCHRTLKNTKRYYLGEPATLKHGYWTYEKVCRKCGNRNLPTVGEE